MKNLNPSRAYYPLEYTRVPPAAVEAIGIPAGDYGEMRIQELETGLKLTLLTPNVDWYDMWRAEAARMVEAGLDENINIPEDMFTVRISGWPGDRDFAARVTIWER